MMRPVRFRRSATFALGAVVALGVGVSACGDDDDTNLTADTTVAAAPAAPAAGSENIGTFCATSLQLAQTTSSAPPPEAGDIEGGKAFAAPIVPLGETLLASAPADLTADLQSMVGIAQQAAQTGDVTGFQTPDFVAKDAKVHAAGLARCGWARQDVELMEYHLMGLPDTMPAGVTSFELKNTGKELHEMVLFRKNDGVTASFQEVLALPDEQALTKVTPMGGAFAAQGQTGYVLTDLTPGQYVALCFVPVGTTSMDAQPPADAPPHFTQGMIHEFTVA